MNKQPDENTFWHLLWSNQAAILSALLVIQSLLPVWKGIIPDQWFIVAGAVLATAIPMLRRLPQKGVQKKLDRERQRRQDEERMQAADFERRRQHVSQEWAEIQDVKRKAGAITGGPRRDVRNGTPTDDVTRTAAVTSMAASDTGSSSSPSCDTSSSSTSCDSGSSF